MEPYYQDNWITLHNGDNQIILQSIPDNSIDAIVTDPPYGLKFMGKKWDYDVPSVGLWQECLRVLKPGGHLLAFGGTRTYHRMTVNIEDAGFEIRDRIQFFFETDPAAKAFFESLNESQKEIFLRLLDATGLTELAWVYGSGFPKSLDVSKAIDSKLGAKREVTETRPQAGAKFKLAQQEIDNGGFNDPNRESFNVTAPASDEAKQWEGWGTALKPSLEPLALARKPLEGTVAENVLKYGVGGLNIDESRIETNDGLNGGAYSGDERKRNNHSSSDLTATASLTRLKRGVGGFSQPLGRFPANLIHDGSDEVTALFPQSEGQQGVVKGTEPSHTGENGIYGTYNRIPQLMRGDTGSAARFFYCAKADKAERGKGNNHPTVKPLDLMRYLIRLITPPDGVVLDPFLGSGSTAIAARSLFIKSIGIEREEKYCQMLVQRIPQEVFDFTEPSPQFVQYSKYEQVGLLTHIELEDV